MAARRGTMPVGTPDSRGRRGGSGMNSVTATSQLNQRRAGGFSAIGRADGDRVFRAAVRHSKHVRILRIAVPACVVAVVIGSLAVAFLGKPLRMLAKAPIDIGSLVVSGTKIM